MSPPVSTSTGDVLYTGAERASLNERWSPPSHSSFFGHLSSPLRRKLRFKQHYHAGDHSPGTTDPVSHPDYLDYEQDVPIVRVEKPVCEACHSHGHHPPHPKKLLEDMLKCRICGNSYHLRCLRAVGLPKLPHGTLLDRHLWSCMKCETLELLLTDSELRQILDALGGGSQGASGNITWPRFVALHERLYVGDRDESGSLPASALALLREDFARFDRDHEGAIAWAQVLTRFVLQVLRKRYTDSELVSMLKPAEVRLLKEEFALRDTHNGGAINVADAKRVVREWRDRMAFVTWRSFLCVMALPVIAARPNTWGGSDYVAFLQDDHVGLLGSMRFPLDLASDKSSEAGNTESDDKSREAADDKSQGALSRQSGKE